MALSVALASCVTHAQSVVSIGTQETTLKLQEGADAPRLISVASGSSKIWKNTAAEALIPSVEQDGRALQLHWTLNHLQSHADSRQAVFVYETASPRMRLTWIWQVRAQTGPVEHTISIKNLSGAEVWIPMQDSFRFRFQAGAAETLSHTFVDKGAGKPTEVGTHELAIPVGYDWHGRSSTYARNEDEREIIPWLMVQRDSPSKDGWYAGIEFSGRTQLTLARDAQSVYGAAGLNPDPGPFRTRLLPNGTFTTPTVFVGGFTGGADGLGNVLRPWVRQVLNNPVTWKVSAYPPLVSNSWGSGMQVDEPLAQRMLRDSAELGLEMLAIDAGWFRGVGDWHPDPVKFPKGFGPLVDEAHKRGLKFGIWVDWAQAGVDSRPGSLNAHDPNIKDWLVADVAPDWKNADFVGRSTDLGFPPAREYARREVERLITDYHLDMLEHDGYLVAKNCTRTDHPHAVADAPLMSTVSGSGISMPDASNSTDVSYHSVRAYYDIYAQMRREHPGLLFEICNDGGRMVDFGSASHGDYLSITDTYDPLSNRRAFYDASHVLPPAMLEDYVEKWPVPKVENFRYMLRSGMMGMLTLMQDTNAWTAEQHAAAKIEFAAYKEKLRPLIRDANLYHVSPRPDGVHWDGVEYFDKRGKGVVYVFRGSSVSENQHSFKLQGLVADRMYHLHFADHSAADGAVAGSELMTKGLSVSLPLPLSSELVFLDEAPKPLH